MRDLLVEEIVSQRKGAIKVGPFGSSLPRSAMVSEGIKVYGQENLISRDWHIGDRRITPEVFQGLRSCELYPGDVVIGMMGSLGHCEIFTSVAEPGIMDSHLLRIQPNLDLVVPEYLRLLLLSDEVSKQISRLSHGSIMAGLSSKIVRRLRLPLPLLDEQRRIVEILNTIDESIKVAERIISKLRGVQTGACAAAMKAAGPTSRRSTVKQEFDITSGITLNASRIPRFNAIGYLRVANV